MNQILGQRIRYFRKRAGLSQLELETAISTSSGSISRIENGDVNPTKETLEKIEKVLKLRDREIAYISGSLMYPASQNDIWEAVDSVKEYLSKKGILAYLVDDRWRMIEISDTFLRFLNIDKSIKDRTLGQPFVKIVLDPSVKLHDSLSNEGYKNTLSNLLSRFYSEVGFMEDDLYYQESVNAIENDVIAKTIWNDIISKKNVYLGTNEARTVEFEIGKIKIPLVYSDEPLQINRRFEVIEYVPNNMLHKILSKLI